MQGVRMFWGKKKEQEIKEIKEAVSGPQTMPLPAEPPKEMAELQKLELAPPSEKPRFAPLFVKIDRYREVLEDIQTLKSLLSDINNLISLRREVEKIKEELDALSEKNIQQFFNVTEALDDEFARPEAAGPYIKEVKIDRVDKYISELQSELIKLQDQLKKLE